MELLPLAEAFGPLALVALLVAGLWRALSTGALKPGDTVDEIVGSYRVALDEARAAHAGALDAERRNTTAERDEKLYWRDTAIRLLEVGERMAESVDGP